MSACQHDLGLGDGGNDQRDRTGEPDAPAPEIRPVAEQRNREQQEQRQACEAGGIAHQEQVIGGRGKSKAYTKNTQAVRAKVGSRIAADQARYAMNVGIRTPRCSDMLRTMKFGAFPT